ncbi:cupin domain-containing protein [Mangrovibrevibacter kandeliae]|uniref:cupin domain-containing protein n=1 Tax=Mangrovibrevibacter kandeliae TaxID=2968473 RepID=UPI002119948B|nr:cupin domain-containing protein [Aurantimonas sp. CSK15Z-1]MCQ8781482.1 cupin domain-containing protein [Aurantimonas sp. CSK15Z-1]
MSKDADRTFARLLVIDPATVPEEVGAPAPDRLIAGNPTFRTWNAEDDGQDLYAGLWEATPGEWRVAYDEWEFFHVISGVSELTEDGGETLRLEAGSVMVIRPGFRGRWKVVETTRKSYVIKV